MFGFLNIYKPVGMTSHDVVNVLRRITKIRQIGHAGTLDPFATGVLPISIGKATRLIEYLEDDKAYIGQFNFGRNTTTYDIEGEITEIFKTKVTEEKIIEALKNFEGKIEQIPPMYSAIKVDGKKLYDYARKGETVDIRPRNVLIEKIELLGFDFENQTAKIYIKCSKGTYIRSIAFDLGKILNSGGYLSKLERVQAGRFLAENAIHLEELKKAEDVEANLINPLDYLPQEKQELGKNEYSKIVHGISILNRVGAREGVVILLKDNDLVAVSKVEGDILKPGKVFINESNRNLF